MDAGRPVDLLARILLALDQLPLKGRSRNTGRVAATLVASADFYSARRARPGRVISALLLRVSERTIERHWRILERLGAATMTVAGTHLSVAGHVVTRDDEGERTRWRDRQEWNLHPPECLARLGFTVDLAPYIERALALLAALAGGPVDNPWPVEPAGSSRVAPSPKGLGLEVSSGGRWFPPNRRIHNTRPNGHRPSGRVDIRAASRPSPTGKRRRGARPVPARSMPLVAVQLARAVLARRRMPWLDRSPRPMLASALSRFAAAGWTAPDVEVAVNSRLAGSGWSVPDGGPRRPVAYLRRLLADVDETAPPPVQAAYTLAAARSAAARERAAARAAESVAKPVGGALGTAGHQAARAVAAKLGKGSSSGFRRRIAEDRERVVAVERALGEVWPASTCEACGTSGPEVAARTELSPPRWLCPPCSSTSGR